MREGEPVIFAKKGRDRKRINSGGQRLNG